MTDTFVKDSRADFLQDIVMGLRITAIGFCCRGERLAQLRLHQGKVGIYDQRAGLGVSG